MKKDDFLSLEGFMKTVAYLRVSNNNQDLDQQRLAILDYAQKHKIVVDEFVSFTGS